MLDKIVEILKNNKNIDGYKIIEKKIESNELFFVKKNVDMDRAKSVHHFVITVYKDIEENGIIYRGATTTNIHPTMNEKEMEDSINDAAFAAQFARNPYYPLVTPADHYETMGPSKFSEESLPYWMNEITKAIYKSDIHEKGGINSCEIFLNKINTRIVNSEGVDVSSIDYDGMVEFITTWKEEGEEVELYRCLSFSDYDPEGLSQEVENMIAICKDKAIAKNTPILEKTSVILTRDAVEKFFSFYYSNSKAAAIYKQVSTWKIGDKIQGECVKGDSINLMLNPFMKNSTNSGAFDEDGFPLKPVTVIDNGILKGYIGNTRYAHYLNVEPTGSIENISVCGGSKTVGELKNEPYLEIAAFSDFTVENVTGDFCGEIRLAWYNDGNNITPVTGGSISGNIYKLQDEIYLSRELQKNNNFEGPKEIKLLNVTVTGVE